ncbi:Cof-type HAD-IIB family hydrolase [Paenibacillus albicereus]|uniref:Cof-type HAD-IIB family hydrolase n=1 Tax=Paenibacillus albicereus TaxID=2726185 RepID=A0A6H2GU14_9BACL|nr:Cof-type HAD-IIB family hydrolase [Paenibacillus albicereus]QJC50900.1 Cof-type HAD-IIB family hydrolase [Paenibacillus albicereus]
MTGKLIFFDVDGTLLDHDKRIPASAKQAVRELQDAGHEVAIATGRGPFMFKEIREELGIDSYISYNGQFAVRRGEVIVRNPIRIDLLQRITERAAELDHPIVYMNEEAMKANIEHHDYIVESMASLELADKTMPWDKDYYIGREIYQCLLFCTIGDEMKYREAFPELGFIRWHQFSMDVLPLGGSKAQGIEAYRKLAGVRPEDVYAFGDGLNDIEMLQAVHNSVAMGNAIESVQKAAKHVTKDVAEDGIRHGLELVGLL